MPLKLKQRKNGKWYISGTIDGKRYRQSTGTDQKEIAEIIFAETQSKIQKAAIYGTECEATFADAAVKYIEDGGETRFLTPLIKSLGKLKLKDIKPGTIKSNAKKIYSNCIPATQNRQGITPAVAVINHGAELGMCTHIRVSKFHERGSKKAIATNREWHEQFIANAFNLRIAAIDLLMFTTGVRITNALELTPEDFDLVAGTAELRETKNGEAHTLHLTDDLISMVRQIQPRQVKDGTIRMFGYYQRSSIYEPWKKTCSKAGIPYIPPHQCGRHTFATELIIRNGVDVKSVARLGGWKSVRLLLEKYTHPEGEEQHIHNVFGEIKVIREDTPENVIPLIRKKM